MTTRLSIIVIHPGKTTEPAVRFARDCALRLLAELKGQGVVARVIKGSKMTRRHIVQELQAELRSQGDIIAFGHGTHDRLANHHHECALHQQDAPLLENKVCYVLACHSCTSLGRPAIDSGAVFFFGLDGYFRVPRYYRDLMMTCMISGILSFLKGECSLSGIEEITMKQFDSALRQIPQFSMNSPSRVVEALICFSNNAALVRFLTPS